MKRKLLLLSTLAFCLYAQAFTLVIDPGHGGRDAGAIGRTSKEKNINLAVALELGRLIERNCPDVKVIYTRKNDTFVELNQRAEIANKAKADLFISIHTNSTAAKIGPQGTETYTLGVHRAADNLEVAKRENGVIVLEKNFEERYEGFDPKSSESYIIFELMQDMYMEKSVELARNIQQHFKTTAQRKDKGVHQAGFLVLRATSMPSVLVELGFINNPTEERFLQSKTGCAALAKSIYNGFIKYKKNNKI